MKEKLKKRIRVLETIQPERIRQVPVPHDYCTNKEARAAYARAVGIDPELLEQAREKILAKYAPRS